MKKVNFNIALTKFDNTPIYQTDGQGGYVLDAEGNRKPFTAKEACVSLLGNVSEEKADGKKKVAQFLLAQKIAKSKGAIEVSTDEIVMVRDIVGKYQSPLVVGQIYGILGELCEK